MDSDMVSIVVSTVRMFSGSVGNLSLGGTIPCLMSNYAPTALDQTHAIVDFTRYPDPH